MTDTDTISFLGIPVHGDIIKADRRKAQRPLEEFTPIIQAVLDDPAVGLFGWTQYTPYFNDGDPCVFSAHGLWAEPAGPRAPCPGDEEDEPDEDEDEDGTPDLDGRYHKEFVYDERWGDREETWDHASAACIYGEYKGPDEAAYDRLHALSGAIDGGEFDDVLLEAFGDHAVIMIEPKGIQVGEYSHD